VDDFLALNGRAIASRLRDLMMTSASLLRVRQPLDGAAVAGGAASSSTSTWPRRPPKPG
jgi:hypothetical protein